MKNNVVVCFVVIIYLALAQQCQGQNWADFQRKHILDPKKDAKYETFKRDDWNAWLKSRVPLDYGTKSINSVIVGQPSILSANFGTKNPTHSVGPDFHWSSNKIQTYVMSLVKSTKTYDAYNCATLYVLVRLDLEEHPMHFHGSAETQKESGKLPWKVGSCTKIQ